MQSLSLEFLGLNRQLQQIEDRIESNRSELSQLEPIKKVRDHQMDEIARLQKELYDTNQKHLEAIQGQQHKLNAERIEVSKNAETVLAQVKQEADTASHQSSSKLYAILMNSFILESHGLRYSIHYSFGKGKQENGQSSIAVYAG